MTLEYIHENLFPGHLGYVFVILSFSAALLSLVAYFFYTLRREHTSWRNIGRISFFVHGISVLGIFSTLFYLIYTHQFQYNYVWSHSSLDLPIHYIVSCFWEGQEGSFLLWTFWHFVLGIILIRTAKSWEGPVLLVLSFAQVTLASMLLGIDQISFFGTIIDTPRIGSNPFILLRQAFPDLPVFHEAIKGTNVVDYVGKIEDGRGLNALLQNYWMVIHPPVLFLGFASTIVPFAFAMGGLWQRRYGEWVRPALPWAVMGCMVLGTGVLMGGAWAYEALSFGGFWAWDPVENGSLVPWLLFVATLHSMMIYRSRKTALLSSIIFACLTFMLILYATFLTRSGILGDSSVHSFTDLGLSGQLLWFMAGFFLMMVISIIVRARDIPGAEKEEKTSSREFWMFIGALVLSLSALHIISITSIPVINKIFGSKLSPPTDPIKTYHQLQVPFAIVIAVLTAVGQYFRFIQTDMRSFWKRTGMAALAAVVLTAGMAALTGLTGIQYILLLWAAFFTVIGNGDILTDMFRKGTSRLSGAAIAHLGFGLLLAGALISNAKKETISLNTEQFTALENASPKEQWENKILLKDAPVKMSDYKVTFLGDSAEKNHIYFKVNYKEMKGDKVKDEFDLYPYILYDKGKDQFITTSPSTKHYVTKDVFTHITAASNKNLPEFQVKYDTFMQFQVNKGEAFNLDSFNIAIKDMLHDFHVEGKDTIHRLTLEIAVTDGVYQYFAHPSFEIGANQSGYIDSEIHEFGLKFSYRMLHPDRDKKHDLVIFRGNRPPPQFITMKAIIFPYINLLWLGSIIMVAGFAVALARRIREYKA
jgi:cytochrome c-type biogenesis protein CcmF